jgi:hypothetical protein
MTVSEVKEIISSSPFYEGEGDIKEIITRLHQYGVSLVETEDNDLGLGEVYGGN